MELLSKNKDGKKCEGIGFGRTKKGKALTCERV
jgi:hypothetical protein